MLVVDRYSAYKAIRQVKLGQLLLAFCWAHVRRDFVRVGKGYPELKDWALAWLLRIRELSASIANDFGTRRGPASKLLPNPVCSNMWPPWRLSEIPSWTSRKLREPCREALESLMEHWNGLTLFVNAPCIPMDNNHGERLIRGLIRGPAVGYKNYYGSGAEWSGLAVAEYMARLITCPSQSLPTDSAEEAQFRVEP